MADTKSYQINLDSRDDVARVVSNIVSDAIENRDDRIGELEEMLDEDRDKIEELEERLSELGDTQ